MNPDLIFVVGVVIFALSVPAVISAFSTSDSTLKPAVVCIVVGGSLIVLAQSLSAGGGPSLNDLPSIVMGLFR